MTTHPDPMTYFAGLAMQESIAQSMQAILRLTERSGSSPELQQLLKAQATQIFAKIPQEAWDMAKRMVEADPRRAK